MTSNDQIKDENLQYDINREAAKISALSSWKRHKYEYLTGEDILPSNEQEIIEQTFETKESFWKTNKNNRGSWYKASWRFRKFETDIRIKSN